MLRVLRIPALFTNGLFFWLGLAGPAVTTKVRVDPGEISSRMNDNSGQSP